MNNNNKNNTNNERVRLCRSFLSKVVDFERIEIAYENCIKRKKNKQSAMDFSFADLCYNLTKLVHEINNRTYKPSPSSCFVIKEPTIREIFAADFRDRVVQHFFIEEVEPLLDEVLIENTASCRKNKGVTFALNKLLDFTVNETNYGKEDAYFLKIDLSGYFMSLDREYITQQFSNLINSRYSGEYREELLFLAPLIYMDDPTFNCRFKSSQRLLNLVPDRKSIFKASGKGLAIGNITAQHGSNLNLNNFDHFCMEELGFPNYIRYVDDIIIVDKDKQKLKASIPLIEAKLKETSQKLNLRKTRIDTVYHGIKFLGHITYPYGYQVITKVVKGRFLRNMRNMHLESNTLSRLNSIVGFMKHYAAHNFVVSLLFEIPPGWPFYFDGSKFIVTKRSSPLLRNELPKKLPLNLFI